MMKFLTLVLVGLILAGGWYLHVGHQQAMSDCQKLASYTHCAWVLR